MSKTSVAPGTPSAGAPTVTAAAPTSQPQPPPPSVALQPSTSYCAEIERMMFAFGDAPRALTASAALVEEIVHSQMEEILRRASEVSTRCHRQSVMLEDVLFVVRKSPIRVQRLARYLSVKDAAATLQQEANPPGGSPPPPPSSQDPRGASGSRIKRCREFFAKLDSCSSDGGVLEQALNGELYDEARMERLRRMERMSRELTGKRYNDFTKARQVNFLGHKMRFPQKFHDWLVKDAIAATWMEPCAKVDKSAIEAFTFLAYEAVGQIVEMSLLARSEMERNRGGAFTTNAVNPRYPMFQLPGLHSAGMATATAAAQPPSTPSSAAAKEDEFDSPLRKRLKSGTEAAQLEQPAKTTSGLAATQAAAAAAADTVRPPLRPEHVREAWRRLQQSPVGRMRLWETAGAARVDEWHEGRGEALLALGY